MNLVDLIDEFMYVGFFFMAGVFFNAERWGWIAFTVFFGLVVREAVRDNLRREIKKELKNVR